MRVVLSIFTEATRALARGERKSTLQAFASYRSNSRIRVRWEYYWDKHKQSVKKKHKYNEDMRGMLELVQKDIDSIRKQAEKEIREAERITNEIGRRLWGNVVKNVSLVAIIVTM